MTFVNADLIPADRHVVVVRCERYGTYYRSEPLWDRSENKAFEMLRDGLAKAGVMLTQASFRAEITRVLDAQTVEKYLRSPRNGSGYLLDSKGKRRLFHFLRPAFEFDEAD